MFPTRPPEAGQLALDIAPSHADSTARFVEFLRSEPTADDVAQELILGYLPQFHARASVIATVRPDATLELAGGFGLSRDTLARLGRCSMWEDLPTAAAIRTQGPVVSAIPEDIGYLAFPPVRPGVLRFMVAVPLTTSTTTVGSVCVCMDGSVADAEAAARTLHSLADIYVLYLRTFLAATVVVPTSLPQVPAGGGDRSARVVDFSRRQKAVLGLLGQGMTYDQIAARIGFSHSTVRMELMHVYRAFGVSSRREAVREAIGRGLIDESGNCVDIQDL